MGTLATLLEALAAARRAGEDFDAAWEVATVQALGQSCDPGDWRPVLDGTRDGWHAAYDRLPAKSCERALADWRGRRDRRRRGVPSLRPPDPTGRGRRARAVFCTDRCRRAWHHERERAAA